MKDKFIIALSICLFLAMIISAVAWGTQYYCPKCGSTDVEVVSIPDERIKKAIEEKKSMDSISEDYNITSHTLEMHHTQMEAKCKKCGYIVSFYVPY